MDFPVCGFCLEHDFWIFRFTGCGLFGWCVFVMCIHIWFCRARKRAGAEGQPKGLFSGLFPVFSWFFRVNSLIINTIHFSDSLRIKLWLLKGLHVFSAWCCSALYCSDRGLVLFFLFQKEKYQKKRKFFVNRSADKKIALRCCPSATGGCLVLVFCRCITTIWLLVIG